MTHGQGRAGFVLVNGGKSGHSCSVKIVEHIRQHAAEQGLREDESLKMGMEAKVKQLLEEDMEVFAKT